MAPPNTNTNPNPQAQPPSSSPDTDINNTPNMNDLLNAVALMNSQQQQQPPNLNRPTSLTRSDSSVSSQDDDISTSNSPSSLIPPDLYMFLVNADIKKLSDFERDWKSPHPGSMWELLVTEDRSTALHIAAEAGKVNLITEFLLPRCSDLSIRQNSKGDLAVHSAVKAGHFYALRALTTWKNDQQIDRIGKDMLMTGNKKGDTPLHIAVENNEQKLAYHLIEEYAEACYQLNWEQVCPLYLAIKAGYWELVKCMISFTKKHNPASGNALIGGKSIVHAAIEAKNLEILEKILVNHGNLIDSFDECDRTPLSYAAFKGYDNVVQHIVGKFPAYAYKCDKDKDGSFPIHSAASGGHIKVINKLHHTRRLLNRKKQNILHMAAANGSSEVVASLLKDKEFAKLINSKDEDGNTPLHLATKGFHPRVVYMLTWKKRVKRELQNKDGRTALDIVETYAGSSPSFEARLTWMALRYVDAPRSSQLTKQIQKRKLQMENYDHCCICNRMIIPKENEKNNLENYKDRINTQLLVATLVATVTFAAGFTLPGGYKQDNDDPQVGMAVLARKWAFQVFVICDTAAMYSSILTAVTLIWAQISELKLVLVSLRLALPLLGFSLAMMSLAFMMGVFVVLSNKLWLSSVVLGMGSLSLVVALVIFIPLYSPSYIRNSVVRYIFSGSFLLLLFVCDKTKVEYR